MPISSSRLDKVAGQVLEGILQRNPRLPPPHPPTEAELQRLSIVTFAISHDLDLQRSLSDYLRGFNREDRKRSMTSLLGHLDQSMDKYEDAQLQNLALDAIPESLWSDIETHLLATQHNPPIGSEDALAIALVKWFKNDFMRWVDPVKCPRCGGETRRVQSAQESQATAEEERGGAGRVEVYRCQEGGNGCGGVKRFPRYNDPAVLMKTREGRCGEYANLFNLVLKAVGLRARYIWNSEDHVWNEYYSPNLQRWVHLDSCEGAWNQHLLYEVGWGKTQAYCLALGGPGEASQDVTRCYVKDLEACMERRTMWDEEDLEAALLDITNRRRAHLPPERLSQLREEDTAQEAWLADASGREAASEALQGRQSGTKEWRAVRQELGSNTQESKMIEAPLVYFNLAEHYNQLQLYGSSSLIPGSATPTLRLTTSNTSQTGSAVVPLGFDAKSSFVVDLTFRINRAGNEGADGMALVCFGVDTNPRKLGVGGGGLGYQGLGGEGDWAVEIDTYRSQDTCNDPPTPHISLHSPPLPHHRYSLACTQTDSLPDLADGSVYHLKVQFNATDGEVAVWLQVDGSTEWIFLWRAVIPNVRDGKTRLLGLTGATGGLAQQHDVLKFVIRQEAV